MVFRRALAWALASRAEILLLSSRDACGLLEGDERGEENGDQRGLLWLGCSKYDRIEARVPLVLSLGFEENLLRRPLPIALNIRRGTKDQSKSSPLLCPSRRALSVLAETVSIALLFPTRAAVV
jgi:hypothetical protein